MESTVSMCCDAADVCLERVFVNFGAKPVALLSIGPVHQLIQTVQTTLDHSVWRWVHTGALDANDACLGQELRKSSA